MALDLFPVSRTACGISEFCLRRRMDQSDVGNHVPLVVDLSDN